MARDPADAANDAEMLAGLLDTTCRSILNGPNFYNLRPSPYGHPNTKNVQARWLKDVRTWSFVDGLGFVAMVGLAVGAILFLGVVFPRLKGSRRGIIFFNAIAEFDNSYEYADDVLTRTQTELVRTKLPALLRFFDRMWKTNTACFRRVFGAALLECLLRCSSSCSQNKLAGLPYVGGMSGVEALLRMMCSQ